MKAEVVEVSRASDGSVAFLAAGFVPFVLATGCGGLETEPPFKDDGHVAVKASSVVCVREIHEGVSLIVTGDCSFMVRGCLVDIIEKIHAAS